MAKDSVCFSDVVSTKDNDSEYLLSLLSTHVILDIVSNFLPIVGWLSVYCVCVCVCVCTLLYM